MFYRLLKNITKFRVAGLGPRPMTWLNKTSQSKKRRPLFSKNVLKIVPIHVYKFSSFNTSNAFRVFGNYFRDARVGDSRRLLKEEQINLYSQHLPKKNFSLISSRKEKKNTGNLWKGRFPVENITFLRFFRAAYLRRGPKRTIENGRLFSNSKQNIYVWNLKLQDYREEHKTYLQGVFHFVTWRFG